MERKRILALLQTGTVKLSYQKKDGTVKKTLGTLHGAAIRPVWLNEFFKHEDVDADKNGKPSVEGLKRAINHEFFPSELERRGSTRKPDETFVSYFDLIAMDWRKVNPDSIILAQNYEA